MRQIPMDKLHTTMVATCDRLLSLVTGPGAARDPVVAEAALEAIEFLQALEGYFKGAEVRAPLDPAVPARFHFRHPAETSHHVTDVLKVLNEEGLCGPAGSPFPIQ